MTKKSKKTKTVLRKKDSKKKSKPTVKILGRAFINITKDKNERFGVDLEIVKGGYVQEEWSSPKGNYNRASNCVMNCNRQTDRYFEQSTKLVLVESSETKNKIEREYKILAK